LEDIIAGISKTLKVRQLKELLKEASLITDPLGQELIAKAASPHSPISIEELTTFKNGSRDEALARLYQFERLGIFKSALNSANGQMKRVFSITELGRKTVLN
jgi:hypothetical protein